MDKKFNIRPLSEAEQEKLVAMIEGGDDLAKDAFYRYKELSEKFLNDPTQGNANELNFLLENQLRPIIILG